MKRARSNLAVISCLGLLNACMPSSRQTLSLTPPGPEALTHAGPRGCHIPLGGGPGELVERGIGGTGGTTPPPQEPPQPSLGVAGIIDGFGSVCLNGLEIGLLPGTTVTTDGAPAAVTDLRVGQQAVLAAGYAQGRPVTNRLLIRHAIIGPIDQSEGSRLVVAGQTVRLAPVVWIDAPLRPGQWVSVSGLSTPTDGVLASRIDPASGPAVLVRGQLQGTEIAPRIGRLPVPSPVRSLPIGSDVVLRGIEYKGVLQVTALQPDLLADDPRALFGPSVRHFLIQTLIGSGARPMASLNVGVALPPGFALPPANQPSVVSVTAVPNGALSVAMPNAGAGGWAGPPVGAPPMGPPTSAGPGSGPNPGHGPPAGSGPSGPPGAPASPGPPH